MDWNAIAAMVVGALCIFGTDCFGFWKRKRPSRGGVIIRGPAHPTYPAGRIFFAHLLSTLAINFLALLAFWALRIMIDRDVYWAWSIIPCFGWLVIWGFVVRPMIFPPDYLAYWEKQDAAPIGMLPAGVCALGWMILMLISLAPIWSVK